MQRCHYKLLSFHYFIVYCRSVISVYNAVPNLHFYTLRWPRGTCFVMFSDFYLLCHRLKLAMLCCRLSLRDSSAQSYPTLWNMNLQYITCSFSLERFLCAADTEKVTDFFKRIRILGIVRSGHFCFWAPYYRRKLEKISSWTRSLWAYSCQHFFWNLVVCKDTQKKLPLMHNSIQSA